MHKKDREGARSWEEAQILPKPVEPGRESLPQSWLSRVARNERPESKPPGSRLNQLMGNALISCHRILPVVSLLNSDTTHQRLAGWGAVPPGMC